MLQILQSSLLEMLLDGNQKLGQIASEVKNLNNEKALRTAILKALESCSCTATFRVFLLYGNNDVCQTSGTTKRGRMNEELRRGPTPELGVPLGIITKSHPTLDTQGFQRIQDYALQQQSAKLLHGKSRVCFLW